MRIGVVIPAYNRPGLVLESLQTIAEQDRPADQVVVVDDCSTDDTADRIADWIRDRDGWSLVRMSENQGPAAARNRGIEALSGADLIAFLDSDDLWPPEHLARMERAITNEPQAVAVVADQLVARKNGRSQLRKADWAIGAVLVGLVRRGGCAPSAMAVRADASARIGGFKDSMRCHEDLEFLLRLSELGPFARADGPPVRYRFGVGCGDIEAASISKHSTGGAERRIEIVRTAFADQMTARRRQLLAWTYFRAARQLFKSGNPTQARSHCWSAIRTAPWYVRPWICLFRSFGPSAR